MGCTMTVGEQAMNIGRNAALAAGFPDTVPGTTVDRQCGSAQQAVHFAAQAVMSGAMDIVIGAGVESMSRVPIGSTTDPGPGEAYGPDRPRPLRVHPPGTVGRGDRPALEDRPRRDGRLRPRVAPARRPGPGRGSLRPRDRPPGGCATEAPTATPPSTSTKGSAATRAIEKLAGLAPAFSEDGTGHGRHVVADLRRGGRRPRDERGARRRPSGCGPGPASTPSPWPPTTR